MYNDIPTYIILSQCILSRLGYYYYSKITLKKYRSVGSFRVSVIQKYPFKKKSKNIPVPERKNPFTIKKYYTVCC